MQKNRNAKRRLRVGTKIAVMYGGMIAVLVAMSSVLIFFSIITMRDQSIQRDMEAAVEQMKAYIEADGQISDSAIARIFPNRPILIAVAKMVDGVPVNEGLPFPFDPENFLEAFRPGVYMVIINNVRYLTNEKNAVVDNSTYIIRTYINYERVVETRQMFLAILILVNITGLTIAALAGRAMSKATLSPVAKIIQTAQSIGIEDLSERLEVSGPDDELKQLGQAFNDMLKRLEVSFRQQAQFVADASHELRTPISVIKGYANLLNRWGKNDPGVLQESLDCIIAETEHMSNMAEKMLLLAREEQANTQRLPVSIREVTETVIKEMELFESKWDVRLNSSGKCAILGDYDMIKQLVWILLDNAVKYSRSYEESIEIDIFDKDSVVCLSVKDHGIGISEEDVPHIFQRFYRADKARTVTADGGAGLGLSIASRIIKQHGAEVTVESVLRLGTRICVYFPISGGSDCDNHENTENDDHPEPGGGYDFSADNSSG